MPDLSRRVRAAFAVACVGLFAAACGSPPTHVAATQRPAAGDPTTTASSAPTTTSTTLPVATTLAPTTTVPVRRGVVTTAAPTTAAPPTSTAPHHAGPSSTSCQWSSAVAGSTLTLHVTVSAYPNTKFNAYLFPHNAAVTSMIARGTTDASGSVTLSVSLAPDHLGQSYDARGSLGEPSAPQGGCADTYTFST